MDPVFFLQSKRFWSLPVGSFVAWLVGKLAAVGFELSGDEQDVLTGVLVAGAVWLFGMLKGNRPLTLSPTGEPKQFINATPWSSLLAGMLAVLVLASCTSFKAETPQQRFYGIKADYGLLLTTIVAYKNSCEAKVAAFQFDCKARVAEAQGIDRDIIWPVLEKAEAANEAGQTADLALLNSALLTAIGRLQSYVLKNGLGNDQQSLRGPPLVASPLPILSFTTS